MKPQSLVSSFAAGLATVGAALALATRPGAAAEPVPPAPPLPGVGSLQAGPALPGVPAVPTVSHARPVPTAFQESLVAAKVLEDGEGDLEQALRAYQGLIRGYDALRPTAAEAVFRAAEIQRRLSRNEEAMALYQRVIGDFPDQTDLFVRSTRTLQALATPATEAPAAPFTMPPELRARYGLGPAAADPSQPPNGAPALATLSPALRARYGLGPVAPAHPPAAAAATSGTAPATMEIDPHTGMPVGGAIDPNTGMPAGAGIHPNLGGVPEGAPTASAGMGPAPVPAAAPEAPAEPRHSVVVDTEELRSLLAERAELRTRRRQIDRELRALQSVPRNPFSIDLIPVEMIRDPRLTRLLAAYEQLDEQSGSAARLSAEDHRLLVERLKKSEAAIFDYVDRVLPTRLSQAIHLIKEEDDRLMVRIDEIQFRLGSR